MVVGKIAHAMKYVLITYLRMIIGQIQMIHNTFKIGKNKQTCYVKAKIELGSWEHAFSLVY